MRFLNLVLLFLITGVSSANSVDPEKVFNEANKLYAEKEFAVAAAKYESLIDLDFESEAVFFNLGNANYQLRKVGTSIYYYKKALQLNPDNKDAQTNLKFADKMKLDTFETKLNLSSNQIIHNLIGALNHNEWSYLSVAFSFLILISFIVFYFNQNPTVKKLFFTLQIVFGFLTLTSLGSAFFEKSFENTQRYAIVFSEEVALKVEPRSSAKNAQIIHEGTEVFIEEESTKWFKVTLPNQVSGWLEKETVKEL